MTDNLRIAVIMTCHNRKSLTLASLESLRGQAGFAEQNLFLVDDGSTDGTGEAVRATLPGANVIEGDGSLYWNGGMRLAWQRGLESGVDFDFYLWLNDDVQLEPGTLEMLVADAEGVTVRGGAVIVSAATREPGSHVITYGAHRRPDPRKPLRLMLVEPEGNPVQVDTISGNIVLVSAAVERRIGNLSPAFEHIYGDLDYGFRARSAGIPVVLASRFGGSCASNDTVGTSLDRTKRRWARVRMRWLEDKRVHARDWQRLVSIHGGGSMMAVLHRAVPYLRILLDRPNRFATTIINRKQDL